MDSYEVCDQVDTSYGSDARAVTETRDPGDTRASERIGFIESFVIQESATLLKGMGDRAHDIREPGATKIVGLMRKERSKPERRSITIFERLNEAISIDRRQRHDQKSEDSHHSTMVPQA